MKLFLLFAAFIGLTCAAPKTLQEDLDEFLALIPVEDIKAVVLKYAADDAEVQRIVAYLQGDEWAALVGAVRDNETVQELEQYLKDAGIDVQAILQKIHDFINGIELPSKVARKGRSLREMIDEIEPMIPVTDLILLLNDKLQNSPDFQAFFEKVSSEETHQMVEEVRALDEVQRIAAILREMGMDLDKILDAIYTFLGWA